MFQKGYKPSSETRAKIAETIEFNRTNRENMRRRFGNGRRKHTPESKIPEPPKFTFKAMPYLQEVVRDIDEKIKVLQFARQKILEAEVEVRGRLP